MEYVFFFRVSVMKIGRGYSGYCYVYEFRSMKCKRVLICMVRMEILVIESGVLLFVWNFVEKV